MKNAEYEDNKFKILGKNIICHDAPEPSNVIWENLETTNLQRQSRKCGVVVVICIFLILTFLLFSVLKSKAGENKLKYPSANDCDAYDAMFEGEKMKEKFKEYAQFDKAMTMDTRGAGYYQCYCSKHSSFQKLYKVEKYQEELCYDFFYDKAWGLALTNFVTVLVAIINIVIRKLNINLIEAIGYETVSKQVSMIMQSVFYATFINTGIILLMTNAELQYSVLQWLPLHGQYPDLNENWYEEIGPQLI